MNGTMVLVGCVLAAGAVAYLGMGKSSAASNHDASGVAGLSTSPTVAPTRTSVAEPSPRPTLSPTLSPSPTSVVISLTQFRNAVGSGGVPPTPRVVSNWYPPAPPATATPTPPLPHAPTAAPTEPSATATPAGPVPTSPPPVEGGWTYPPTPPLPPPPYYPPPERNHPSGSPAAEGPAPATE